MIELVADGLKCQMHSMFEWLAVLRPTREG